MRSPATAPRIIRPLPAARHRRRASGLTLVEVMITVALFAIITMTATPTLAGWMQSTRTRAVADAVLKGLQRAKTEAVMRNGFVRFQLTSSLQDDCTVDANGRHWVVNADPWADPAAVEGHCATVDPAAPPRILAREELDQTQVQLSASDPSIAFNGYGRLAPRPAQPVSIDIRSGGDAACTPGAAAGSCLRVTVSPDGMLRMCNPQLGPDRAGDPRLC